MQLVILEEETWSDRVCWIKDVNLKDGALPTISGQSANIIGLEPAVWAKVKVLNLVVINLTQKVLHWCTCRPQDCIQRRSYYGNDGIKQRCNHTHSVQLDSEEMVRQCDFEDLLKITRQALQYPSDPPKLLWEMFRLLHLHILPLIYFTKDEDEAEVDRALENQNKVLREIEKLLDEKSEERRLLQKELCSKRQIICKMLEEDGFNLGDYCNEFITILEGGLSEDLKSAFTEIDRFCSEIEELNQMEMRSKGKTHFDETLERIKKERDEHMVYLSTVLIVREEIENFCRETPATFHIKEISDVQREYMEEAEKWKLLSNVAEKLFWTKIHAVSIREALSFQQLEMRFSSGSPRTTKFSIKVMSRDSLPTEWQTMDEQVTKALERNDVIIAIHQSGKASIMKLCLSSTTNSQPPCDNKEKKRLHRKGGIRRKDSINKLDSFKQTSCYEQRVTMFCSSFMMTSPSDMFGALVTKVMTEVKNLFEKVTQAFLNDNNFKCNNGQRLWICYEKFVFPDLLFHYIIPIYQRAHQIDLTKLQSVLGTVTLKRLGLEDEPKLLKLLGLSFEINEDEKDQKNTQKELNNLDPKEKDCSSPQSVDNDQKATIPTLSKLFTRQKEKLLSASKRRQCFHRQASVDMVEDSKPLNFVPFRSSVSDEESWDFLEAEDELEELEEEKEEEEDNTRGKNGDTDDEITRQIKRQEFEMKTVKINNNNHRDGGSQDMDAMKQKVNVMEFQNRFRQVFTHFSQALTEPIPYVKLERLTQCLSKFTCLLSQQANQQEVKFSMSADDLLSSVILLLAYGHPDIVSAMYIHIIFLRDYIPTFMENGKFGYTLISFLGGYSALLEIAESNDK
ncbi:hypothetical protein BSL78_22576 [Apostichopus japonicus]|uniref:VPS9 domain-containing protein n=1 Tax=Stichopus japonicus TaxID=307972 RepID=A0A2G8JXZ9_STIJA|nr:hypothetical protein BSL78_22576 [Apostichopus japonicus]